MLISQDFPQRRLDHPPSGWRVAARTPNTDPVGRARTRSRERCGGVVVARHRRSRTCGSRDSGTSFRVDAVPADGGTVVLSLLDWPGYATDVGSLADPVDGYLVTVRLPASAQGETVHVGFHPPGWTLEVAAWALALADRRRLVAAPRRTAPPRAGRLSLSVLNVLSRGRAG